MPSWLSSPAWQLPCSLIELNNLSLSCPPGRALPAVAARVPAAVAVAKAKAAAAGRAVVKLAARPVLKRGGLEVGARCAAAGSRQQGGGLREGKVSLQDGE